MADILILDDDPEFREFVAQLLDPRGHRCLPVGCMADAWTVLAEHQVQLVLVDGLLPDGTGVDFIAELRKRGREAPVLFISAFWWDASSFEVMVRRLGVVRVLSKPITPGEFLVEVESALRPAGPPVQSAQPVDLLAQARQAYSERLPERLGELRLALEGARHGDAAALQQAEHMAHKLQGSAGTYGYEQVSAAASRLERLLEDLGGARDPGWVEADALLERALGGANIQRVTPGLFEGRGVRVLLAANANPLLKGIEHLGTHRAITLQHALTAPQALRLAERTAPDMAILGLRLGGRDAGIDLAAALRALPGLERLPIAFLSAGGEIGQRIAAVNAGVSLILEEPLTPDDVAHAVEDLVAAASPEPPSAMLVSASPARADLLRAGLERAGCELALCTQPVQMLDALGHHQPEALLLDVELPGVSAFDLCRTLRTTAAWSDLPVLLVGGPDEPGAGVAALQAGADDYLPNSVGSAELLATLQRRVAAWRHARTRAAHDPLTGLLNRALFAEVLGARLSEARRRGEPVAIALVAIDDPTELVRMHGQGALAQVRAWTGRMVGHVLRRYDLRGQWSPVHFGLAFVGEQPESSTIALNRLLQQVREHRFRAPGGATFHVTCSAAVVGFPGAGSTLSELFTACEALLTQAARRGGDRTHHESL